MYDNYKECVDLSSSLEEDKHPWYLDRYTDVAPLQGGVVWKSKMNDFRDIEARRWEALNVHQRLLNGKYREFTEELEKCGQAYAHFRDGKELSDGLVKMEYTACEGVGGISIGGWFEDPSVQKAQYGELEEMPTLLTNDVPVEARKIAQERLENGEGPRISLRQDLYDLYLSNDQRSRHIYYVRGVCDEIMYRVIHERYSQYIRKCPRWQQHFIDVIANGRKYVYAYHRHDDRDSGYGLSLLRTPEDGGYVEDFDTGQYASEHLPNV
ncbi:MAG: hypothetical protein GF334_11015 [Candidatus Altiarchaeales archaeon]|nr:hypothetical protein [Candidatus Altiarchaeales archaeon]